MIYTQADNRREQWVYGGWNVGDDDAPRRPEPDALSSAQSRRYWKACEPEGQAHTPAD